MPTLILSTLAALSAVSMILERWGKMSTPVLSFKGDIKRETRMLAQYGQLVSTLLIVILILQLDRGRGPRVCEALLAATLGVTIVATLLKRLLGRARPRSEHAGQFLGPALRHANYRESFPSSHSAAAFACSGVLAIAYPHAAVTFWTLAIICAMLRYVMDAHWPSDVLAGIALGYLAAIVACWFFF